MTRRQRGKRAAAMIFWRIVNPLVRPLAGWVPWWVILETTGRRSARPRRVPLARGPVDAGGAWLLAVHGQHAAFIRNIEADPNVRLFMNRRWRPGTASVRPIDGEILRRFNPYARTGRLVMGIDPVLLRVELDQR